MATKPFTGGVSRRQAITAATAAAIIPTTASAAIDPHPTWLEEWRALTEIEATLPDDSPDPGPIDHAIAQLEDLIASTQATTSRGVIAKLQLYRGRGSDYGDRLTEDVGADCILVQIERFLEALS